MSATRRFAAVVVLAFGMVVGAASSASAHAVLLRTDPAPQTTVPRSPSEVRLFFSERVEATLGAIRVYNVDGNRVDKGKLSRSADHREIAIAVPRLADGTYTVTWKVVSADSHQVHGGFTFYVGAPSTISAVAITGDRGPTRWVTWGAGVVRFLWFAAFLGLIGATVLRLAVWTPAMRARGETASETAAGFRRRFRRLLPALWLLLLGATLLLLPFESAAVAGRFTAVGDVLSTTFGHYWTIGLALTVVLGLPVWALV